MEQPLDARGRQFCGQFHVAPRVCTPLLSKFPPLASESHVDLAPTLPSFSSSSVESFARSLVTDPLYETGNLTT